MRTVSVKERDALLNELHSLAGSFRSKHDKLHEQVIPYGSFSWLLACNVSTPNTGLVAPGGCVMCVHVCSSGIYHAAAARHQHCRHRMLACPAEQQMGYLVWL